MSRCQQFLFLFLAPLPESQSSLCYGELSVMHACVRPSVNLLLQTTSPLPLGQLGWNFIGIHYALFESMWLVLKLFKNWNSWPSFSTHTLGTVPQHFEILYIYYLQTQHICGFFGFILIIESHVAYRLVYSFLILSYIELI